MRNLFEILAFFRDELLLMLTILISLTLFLTTVSPQAMALQRLYTGIITSVPSLTLGLSEMMSYKEENQALRQRLMRYALINAELAEAGRENDQLRRMLHFTETQPYDLQVAEVINRGASTSLSTVTLNVGTNQSVLPNQPVLTMDGLLGKTITVAQKATVVHLVNDRNFRLSVKVGSEGLRGILEPLYGPFAEISGLLLNSPIQPGDQVVSSGFSAIYPKNMPVAVVDEVVNVPGESFSRVRVRLNVDPSEAEYVFVMVGRGAGS